MQYKYNKNTGRTPAIGDVVKICHTSSDMDGLTGRIGGWVDYSRLVAIVHLDYPYEYPTSKEKVTAIAMTVVCLNKLSDLPTEVYFVLYVPDYNQYVTEYNTDGTLTFSPQKAYNYSSYEAAAQAAIQLKDRLKTKVVIKTQYASKPMKVY